LIAETLLRSFWLPGSGIIQNKSWSLKSCIAYGWCVKLLNARRWTIPLFDHLPTQEISKYTNSFWMKWTLMFCTLFVFIQSATSSGNSLSAMSIRFGSLMNCIICSWVKLMTYCTGCSNTWKLEMWRINLIINSHQYHNVQASSTSLNHSIRWKAAPGREKRSSVWSEYSQWIALRLLTAPRMMDKSGRNSLWWKGNGSSAGIMWIIFTCEPT